MASFLLFSNSFQPFFSSGTLSRHPGQSTPFAPRGPLPIAVSSSRRCSSSWMVELVLFSALLCPPSGVQPSLFAVKICISATSRYVIMSLRSFLSMQNSLILFRSIHIQFASDALLWLDTARSLFHLLFWLLSVPTLIPSPPKSVLVVVPTS